MENTPRLEISDSEAARLREFIRLEAASAKEDAKESGRKPATRRRPPLSTLVFSEDVVGFKITVTIEGRGPDARRLLNLIRFDVRGLKNELGG
jgi:hypothetical protein